MANNVTNAYQNPKTRYSDNELEEFRVLIEQRKAKSMEKLSFFLAQISEHADNTDSRLRTADDSVGAVEIERAHAQVSTERKFLTSLDNALSRIHSKTYGICRETGTLIPKERLRAVPHATLSISAKLPQR